MGCGPSRKRAIITDSQPAAEPATLPPVASSTVVVKSNLDWGCFSPTCLAKCREHPCYNQRHKVSTHMENRYSSPVMHTAVGNATVDPSPTEVRPTRSPAADESVASESHAYSTTSEGIQTDDAQTSSADGEQAEMKLPAHAIWVRWQFAQTVSCLEFDINILNDPGTKCGLYCSPLNGTIDGAAFYFGIQTDVADPDTWKGLGKGLIFSTWWTFDLEDLRTVQPDGFYQQGTHEGKFIGVRRLYDWTTGKYRVKLARTEPDRGGDWFELAIRRDDGNWFSIGSLRFPRKDTNIPATIALEGTGFMEVYSNASSEADIEDWKIEIMGFSDGQRAVGAKTEYPKHPFAEVMHTDAFYNNETNMIHLAMGRSIDRRHAPATLQLDAISARQ